MKQTLTLVLPPEIAFDEQNLLDFVAKKLNFNTNISENSTENPSENMPHLRLLRRSVDARSREIKVNIEVEVSQNEPLTEVISYKKTYKNVANCPQAIIVGAGPAGMFAALRLIELGIKPIVLERGKDVQARRRDLAAINKSQLVNAESNYCFGEGGAGTYSDGKLYTRSKKRGDIRRILEIFVAHGAKEEILADAHPHIGTNKLPKIVSEMRESIISAGGEFIFDMKVIDFIIKNNEIKGVIAQNLKENNQQENQQNNQKEFLGIGVILATGHSARDIFELLEKKKIHIEAKPFALGVRIEHQQSAIDQIQYHKADRGKYLPASSYSLVSQVNYKGEDKGVFSFCMCPGGFIVPAATSAGEIVVNGMSPSRRDSKYANSGMVVSVDAQDWQDYADFGALAALEFQKSVEKKACIMGGGTQVAPAQLMQDFVNDKISTELLATSYQPGLLSVDMREVLPTQIAFRLKEGFKIFGAKMRGYLTNNAQIIGVESRTSSPVKVPRHTETLEHIVLKRFFPCGEGAGYAGGIMSAAMDGERCAEKLAQMYG